MAGGVRYIPEEFGKPKEWCHPHHRIPTDLEPAFVIGKDESCCSPTSDPCECVTSGDIEKWNFVYDNFSALTGIDVSGINDVLDDVSALNSSAELWNETFEVVSSNSANWNVVDELQTLTENHEARIQSLEEFREDTLQDLNFFEEKFDNLNFDTSSTENPYYSISGDGSKKSPFGVRDYASLKIVNDNLDELNQHIIKLTATDPKDEKFIFDGAAQGISLINNRLNTIDKVNSVQTSNIQRNYELITEIAGQIKTKQDKLKFGYDASGRIVTINNSALAGGGGEYTPYTGDAQGALDQVYANSAIWLTAHQDLSDYATTAELETNVKFILDEVATKLDATAFKPEEFYPMEGNPSGFLTAHQDLSNYATIDYVDSEIDNTYNELADEIDTKLDTSAFTEVSGTFITSANENLSGKYLVLKDNEWTIMPEIGGYTTANGTGDDNHPDIDKPSTKLIYLVKDTETTGKDNYYEWIYSVDESHEPALSSWECIGDTSMDLSDYATIDYVDSSINTVVEELSEQIGTKLDTSAFNPEEFYPMHGNPSGFLVDDDLSGYATKELLEDVAYELADEIDTKQRILSAGDYIDIVSGEDADIISVTGFDTNTYFNATYNKRTSTDYFTFDGTKLSANSAIGYFNLIITYKVNTNNTIEDNYYSVGINVNDIEVDKHYIDGKIPSETYTFSKNVLNNAENNLYEIIKNTELGVSISDLNITCIGFIGEADAVNVGILGTNGNILTFGNTILRV